MSQSKDYKIERMNMKDLMSLYKSLFNCTIYNVGCYELEDMSYDERMQLLGRVNDQIAELEKQEYRNSNNITTCTDTNNIECNECKCWHFQGYHSKEFPQHVMLCTYRDCKFY